MYAVTAAHKTLPLGTHVRVYNLDNNKTVDVRVNDRGPFVRGRIIDLSYEAARRIGVVGPGTAPVKIVALGSVKKGATGKKGERVYVPEDYYVGDFTVQVGAFREKKNAIRLRNKLANTYKNAHIAVHEGAEGKTLYRVRVARCRRLENARKYEKILESAGYTDAVVVAR
jgi:rare lipoprotein A